MVIIIFKKTFIIFIISCLFLIPSCDLNQKNNTKKQSSEKIINTINNYTYSNLKDQISKIDTKYNNITITEIGKSQQNRNLYSLSLGKGVKKIAIIAGVHGREGLTSLLTMKLIEEYLIYHQKNENFNEYNLNKLFDEITLIFIPMLNPDGIEIAVNGIKHLENKEFYIKANEGSHNFEHWKANSRGVDLNKQFRADWEKTQSTESPHFSDYKGPEPESELESRAIANLIRKENFATVLAFHHSGRVIYWYYNQKDKDLKRDKNLAEKISAINGYTLVNPADSDLHAAGFKDWFIKEFKKPGFTIEIGYKRKSEKPLPSDKLDLFFKENRYLILELAEMLHSEN